MKSLKISLVFFAMYSYGACASQNVNSCLIDYMNNGAGDLTLDEVRSLCAKKAEKSIQNDTVANQNTPDKSVGDITARRQQESRTEFDPYVITPHNINYILPALTSSGMNKEAYSVFNGYEDNLEDLEAKFQLSFKVPLNSSDLFIEGDALYFGMTLQAWWQIYASNISKPFRETNYRPEIYYYMPTEWTPFNANTAFVFGFEHQSNGQAQNLSRSWNRIYTNFLFEKDDFVLSLRPWYRLEEDPKAFEFDPEGDDNPDIDDFMGHFELGMVYEWNQYEFGFMGRQNFATHKGAAELSVTFPLWGKLRGYATAFTGYGESLIDYNHKQTRFGIGIALNDIL